MDLKLRTREPIAISHLRTNEPSNRNRYTSGVHKRNAQNGGRRQQTRRPRDKNYHTKLSFSQPSISKAIRDQFAEQVVTAIPAQDNGRKPIYSASPNQFLPPRKDNDIPVFHVAQTFDSFGQEFNDGTHLFNSASMGEVSNDNYILDSAYTIQTDESMAGYIPRSFQYGSLEHTKLGNFKKAYREGSLGFGRSNDASQSKRYSNDAFGRIVEKRKGDKKLTVDEVYQTVRQPWAPEKGFLPLTSRSPPTDSYPTELISRKNIFLNLPSTISKDNTADEKSRQAR